MKATDLMIGDYVYAYIYPNGSQNQKDYCYARVTEIKSYEGDNDSTFCKGKIVGTDEFFSSPLDTIVPIPLTPEILEKNGFIRLDETGYEYVYSRCDVTFSVCKRKFTCPYIRFAGYYFCYINYVHELQHALRICGLKELADNFEVEKDIEMLSNKSDELIHIQVGDVLLYRGNEYEVGREFENMFLAYQKLPNGKIQAVTFVKSLLPLYVQDGLMLKAMEE